VARFLSSNAMARDKGIHVGGQKPDKFPDLYLGQPPVLDHVGKVARRAANPLPGFFAGQ
jgi:hypothetical protein